MALFIEEALKAKSRMEQLHGFDALGFRGGIFHNPEAPFLMLGPVTSVNHVAIQELVNQVLPAWTTPFVTDSLSWLSCEK